MVQSIMSVAPIAEKYIGKALKFVSNVMTPEKVHFLHFKYINNTLKYIYIYIIYVYFNGFIFTCMYVCMYVANTRRR